MRLSLSLLLLLFSFYLKGEEFVFDALIPMEEDSYFPASKPYHAYKAPDAVARNYQHYNLEFIEMALHEKPVWADLELLNEVFQTVRDLRFIKWNSGIEMFDRRIPWLFLDDGCHLRAELVIYLIQKLYPELALPVKVFAFGKSKEVHTPYHPNGVVSWTIFHVAPMIAIGDLFYVIDPSINPFAPMLLEDWGLAMGITLTDFKIAVCKPHTLDADTDCYDPKIYPYGAVLKMEKDFLDKEWKRLLELNFDPYQMLGNGPPWY